MARGRKGMRRGRKITTGRMRRKGQGEEVYHEIGKNKDIPAEGWTE